jgi:hypothetical protein
MLVHNRVDVPEVVVLEEYLRGERIFSDGFGLLVLLLLRLLTSE